MFYELIGRGVPNSIATLIHVTLIGLATIALFIAEVLMSVRFFAFVNAKLIL